MFEKLVAMLDEAGAVYTIHEHQDARTIKDVAAWWPYGLENLLKTVAFKLKDGRVVLAGVRALDRIDYKKLAGHLGVSRRAVKSLAPERWSRYSEWSRGLFHPCRCCRG